jgi:hypothetical protein
MLNMKKGLAVALAAATVLTFAPVSALAGSTIDPNRADTNANKNTLRTTMNETANTWKFEDIKSGTGSTAKTLANENTAVVVLTPDNPTGTVDFTLPITDNDTLASGVWYTNGSNNDSAFTTSGATDQTNSDLKLTASKYSKTLKIEASVPALRSLTDPVEYTISQTAADSTHIAWVSTTNFTPSGSTVTSDVTNFQVKVILAKTSVKMNNLKVTIKNAGDSAYNRYLNADADEYNALEARPTSVTHNAIVTDDTKDVALDGKPISGKTLNLADASKDLTFKVESNTDVIYESNDNSIATIDKDGIHAKAVGSTTVKIKTKQSMTNYGEVTVSIPVEVINKPKAQLTVPSDLTVKGYGKSNATVIGATGTNIVKNSIQYDFVYWDPINQKYVSFRSGRDTSATSNYEKKLNPFVLDKATDTVYVNDYTGYNDSRYQWDAYLAVTATGAEGYLSPDTQYVKLHFDNSPAFELDATEQNLHVGESVQITAKSTKAVTGAAFTYKSYNPAVATVSDKGVIKAVGEGSTTVDVTYGGSTQSVKVNVKAYENGQGSVSAPEKVTGVTVSNKKGAKVSVSWTSQNGNVNYRVYKKVGSGKWVAKNVTSNKATLSVKKGAKVTVKVKAFVKGTDGKTVWGPKATSKSLKTDRK